MLTILSDFVTNELVQTKELEALHVEPEDLQSVEFEPINNHLTHENIKGVNKCACSLLSCCAC